MTPDMGLKMSNSQTNRFPLSPYFILQGKKRGTHPLHTLQMDPAKLTSWFGALFGHFVCMVQSQAKGAPQKWLSQECPKPSPGTDEERHDPGPVQFASSPEGPVSGARPGSRWPRARSSGKAGPARGGRATGRLSLFAPRLHFLATAFERWGLWRVFH